MAFVQELKTYNALRRYCRMKAFEGPGKARAGLGVGK